MIVNLKQLAKVAPLGLEMSCWVQFTAQRRTGDFSGLFHDTSIISQPAGEFMQFLFSVAFTSGTAAVFAQCAAICIGCLCLG